MTDSFAVRAVLLDMDGTLVDSTAVVEATWTDWAHTHGFDPAEVLAVAHGRQAHATMAVLLPDRPHEENLAENRAFLDRETEQTDGVTEIAGAANLLAALRGLPHALVTSADDRLARVRMDAAGLPLPPVLVTAEDVERSKPDPEGFLRAADLLGVDPADCVVLEDSGPGIEAARRAGARVLGVGTGARAHHPDAWVPDLRGVRVEPAAGGLLLTVATDSPGSRRDSQRDGTVDRRRESGPAGREERR